MQKIDKVCYVCGTSWISEVETGSEIQRCNCLSPYSDLDPPDLAGYPTKQARNEACRQKLLQADSARLTALLEQFQVDGPTQLAQLVLSAYREPHRVYHTIDHIRFCLAQLDTFVSDSFHSLGGRKFVEAAIWFHDVVCYPTKTRVADVELAATWAASKLHSDRVPEKTKIWHLIMATDHEHPIGPENGHALQLVADIDLSILGSNYFSEYESLVRAEYTSVPYPVYARGRRDYLEKFLAVRGGQIFQTGIFRQRYEVRAQENLSALLEKLSKPTN